MRVGAATYTFLWTDSVEQAVEKLVTAGFTDVELMTTAPHISPTELGRFERLRLRRAFDRAGARIVSLNPTYLDINLASSNTDIRQASIRSIQANIELAADLGARIVVVVPGRRHPLIPAPLEDVWDVAMHSISRCVDLAESLGIECLIEPVPTLFVERVADAVRMVEELGRTGCGVVYDSANAVMVEDPLQGLKDAGIHLRHVHLSDSLRSSWGHLPLGSGEIDFGPLVAQLRASGYNGDVMLEVIDQVDPIGGLTHSRAVLEEIG